MLKQIQERRSIRFFTQQAVPEEILREMIDGARVTSCAGNMQQLRYVVVSTPELAEKVFEQTAWGAMVRPKRNPQWGKTAAPAYIAVLGPSDCAPIVHADAGAAIQSMQLIAHARGLGSCWLGAIQRAALCALLRVSPTQQLLYLLAVGYPGEKPLSEDVAAGSSLRYYLDEQDRLHVPKLCAEDVARWC
jgi:FMN reductase [NAD(P)H]